MNQKSIMIVGLGDLGGYVLEFLARVPKGLQVLKQPTMRRREPLLSPY